MKSCAALIVAAGRGERFGGDRPKQYQRLCGVPVLRRTVLAFLHHPGVQHIQVVHRPEHRAWYDEAVAGLGLPDPVAGGADRQVSVRRGLEHLASSPSPPEFVLIHDAARPLIRAATISAVRDALDEWPGAIAAIRVVDTLKRETGGFAGATVERAGLWHAQTPQGFRFPGILEAHRAAAGSALTDDAAAAERAGMHVRIVHGDSDNMKITTADDLHRAELLIRARLSDVRTGMGFDVHRFAPGDHVTLCGVRVAHDARLEGHSDADVGLHALTDAILGAIGAGDIGTYFPPGDPRWRGADSALFLEHAVELVRGRGGIIAHADVTLICERPRIGPHRPAMVARMSELLGISADRVSVKATTTERLGFTGRGEGIAAQAICTIRLPEGGDDALPG